MCPVSNCSLHSSNKNLLTCSSYLQLVLVSPDIKYQAAYLFSGDKKHSVFCLSFVYTLELINKETDVPTEVLIFHLRETGKKNFKSIHYCHHMMVGGGGGGEIRLLSRGRWE